MSQLISEQQKNNILTALNEAADAAVWQKSTFLRVIGKQVANVRDNFSALINNANAGTKNLATETNINEGIKNIRVFISLYSSKGTDLKNWEHILANLPGQLISRQIYADENNVKSMIKSKTKKDNDAYLCISIKENYIAPLPKDKIPTDKLKQPLLTIRGNPILQNYQGIFVHSSGRYEYSHGHLTKLT